MTRPDIVIRRKAEVVAIVDTKWKRLAAALDDPKQGIGQGDVYQMMAYARLYDCRRLMLVYPHHEGVGKEERLTSRHRINGSRDDELLTATIELPHLAEMGERLRSLVAAPLGARRADQARRSGGVR